MKISLLPVLLFLFTATGCAQQKQIIQKTFAFYQISLPGNIPVDDGGNPEHRVDTAYHLYLEARKPAPEVAYVILNGMLYNISMVELQEPGIAVGKAGVENETVFIQTSPGHTLWKLVLGPAGPANNGTGNKIAFREGKRIRLSDLPPLVQLQPVPHY